MILRNYTPFPPLLFESRDVEGRNFGVLVLRGTFDIVPGAVLWPNPKQHPIVESDIWHGEPNASSVYMESDLAPFKPRTDVMINAVAHAPGGRPLPEWMVRVEVGTLRKSLRVTGPRAWVRKGGEWRLSDPEPAVEVPIRYEHAFGGMCTTPWRETHICEENPVGVGFVEGEIPSHVDRVPAPQIESPDDPVVEFGKRYRPEGLGPIARSWQPRLTRAGTTDEDWQRSRCPKLPLDFDFSFYNAAHRDLIYSGLLQGDEVVSLEGLSVDGALRFLLPGYRIGVLLGRSIGPPFLVPCATDTAVIDVPGNQVSLTWRAIFRMTHSLCMLDVRMTR